MNSLADHTSDFVIVGLSCGYLTIAWQIIATGRRLRWSWARRRALCILAVIFLLTGFTGFTIEMLPTWVQDTFGRFLHWALLVLIWVFIVIRQKTEIVATIRDEHY